MSENNKIYLVLVKIIDNNNMMLQRYTIVKNIAGKIRKINFKKQDSSKNMPVKVFIYLFTQIQLHK